jgi:hypothetical protein
MSVPRHNHGTKPPDGFGWGDPIAEQLKLCWAAPNFLCDGRMVYRNTRRGELFWLNDPKATGAPPVTWQVAPAHTTPQELLSGEGYVGHMDLAPYAKIASLVYPDLSPRAGWGFEFDPRPTDAPGCVLIKRSAHIATEKPTVGHEWYYIDPAKGYAVVRLEAFTLPANVPADLKAAPDRYSVRMEDFHQSPQGFWYPSLVRDSMPLSRGPNQKVGSKVQRLTTTVHYHFDFDVPLPDWLFLIDDASKPKQ